jgi:hypothetical protein
MTRPAGRRIGSIIDEVASSPSHAVALIGPAGRGKYHLGRQIAERLLGSTLEKAAYYLEIGPEKNVITIDRIRELRKFMSLKTAGTAELRRVVLLHDAHRMNNEAQNALLKILEEPPEDSVIILTVEGERSLRPTIYSRLRCIRVPALSLEEALDHFTRSGHEEPQIRRAFLVSDGGAGLMHALVEQTDGHPLAEQIIKAKEILSSTRFDRLVSLNGLLKDRHQLPALLEALKKLARAGLSRSLEKNDMKEAAAWRQRLEAVYQSEASLVSNPNNKLLLTNLLLRL